MSRLGFYVFCAALCSLAILGQGNDVTTQPPEIINISKHPSPPTTTTTTTTTENPTTSTTTTTEKPTTTQKPTTTTTTTTTTEKPTTTPPPKPTPKPSPPGPLPPPDQGTWTYSENNITCVIVQFAAQLNVTYTKAVNNSTSLANVLLNVPANSTVTDGSCASNSSRQWLVISWTVGNFTANNMTLHFYRNDTTKNYELQGLNVSLTAELFPNSSSKNALEFWHGTEWQTPLATSYRCAQASILNMMAETGVVATLTLSRLQEEAFRTSSGKGFSAARECGGGDVPDAVPIAVGCALGGLVVVVLVAYLVGRRRSAARGYLSM